MTDFEKAVRDALESLLLNQQGEDSSNPEDWDSGYANHQARYLAPRVAAAIQKAAARGVNLGVMEPHLPNGLAEARREALQVLRGSGETPQP